MIVVILVRGRDRRLAEYAVGAQRRPWTLVDAQEWVRERITDPGDNVPVAVWHEPRLA